MIEQLIVDIQMLLLMMNHVVLHPAVVLVLVRLVDVDKQDRKKEESMKPLSKKEMMNSVELVRQQLV